MPRRPWFLIAAAVLLAGAVLLAWRAGGAPGAAATSPAAADGETAPAARAGASAAGAGPGSGGAPFSAAGLQQRQAQLAIWQARYERAEQVYASYRDATRYPHDSRPIAEHPDQVRPFEPVTETKTLRKANGDPVRGVQLRTGQDRVFLSGTDAVVFTLEALDDQGRRLPLVVTRATAQTIPDARVPAPLVSAGVDFADNGAGGDLVAGDGVYAARLVPAQRGFAGVAGTIRLLAQVRAGGEDGVAHFDVVYTPAEPATWGGVREALEDGSLVFYLKASVSRGGRYVVSARVDDAAGNPFALLGFNEEVTPGEREFRLVLFGALVRDRTPAFPLALRDVDGFLLIPDTFPDRAMMARRPGVVHRSGTYALMRFSDAEWTSEERERYLAEYARDAETARAQVQRLQSTP